MLRHVAATWEAQGHRVVVVAGSQDWPDADVAILHVDLTVIPEEYRRGLNRFPVVVNGAALDISKRVVSRNLLNRDDAWTGAVVVKSNLNDGGVTEQQLAYSKSAHRPLLPGEVAYVPRPATYEIFPSIRDVPDSVWESNSSVVERFLPEHDASGYSVRAWIFFGKSERCTRWRCDEPIVKATGMRDPELVPVPEELRAERRRLGFDYGKFDFVVHDDRVVLFDANRTPGAPPPRNNTVAANAHLAAGLDEFLK